MPSAILLATCTVVPRPALALQPLSEFLEHARTWNPQNAAAHATTRQRSAEVGISTGNLLPNFVANGIYTRNQYEVTTASLLSSIPPSLASSLGSPTIIQPLNQVDANLTLTVPILNVGNWDRKSGAKATLAGAQADEANTQLSIQKNIVRGYYALLGYQAVLLSAATNLGVAQHNVKLAKDKTESGTGSPLDVQRAIADQARSERDVTAAQLNLTNAQRDLFSLSGINPEPATAFPEDDLHEELPLTQWSGKSGSLPSVKSAHASVQSAEAGSHAAHTAWFPTVSADAEEKFTNATAFIGGHSAVYLLQLTAQLKLDTTLGPQIRAQDAAAAAARANEENVRKDAEDAVFHDWQQIRADIESARSARSQVAAAKLAASLAEDRYEGGVATQLDVLQARQDAFSADVARIQADADLAYARAALRLDAGELAKESR